MNIRMGNDGTKSNGHGMGRPEGIDPEETMRGLKMEVFRYKANNERMIREKK